MHKCICENCGCEFERAYKRRFCGLGCWHKFNARRMASFNDSRFQWSKATEEEKRERIRMQLEKFAIRKEGCWGWSGYKDKDGYALINTGSNGKGYHERRAHRISWELINGKIPDGKMILHSCDNPICTNPDHLFSGNNQTNSDDKLEKERGNRGSKHGLSKLTEDQVFEIRKMYLQGYKPCVIREKFSISPMTLSQIMRNKIWKHVPFPTEDELWLKN